MAVDYRVLSSVVNLKEYQEDILEETLSSMKKSGQGAISLFPGGGKSFIGAVVAATYIDEHPDKEVLWMGPLAANNNVNSSVISKLPYQYRKRIHFKSYDSMSHGHTEIDIHYDDVCLIVMDESHKALANIAYEGVSKVLSSCDCDRLAMSATGKRTDGRNSFNVLVPMAVYENYDFSWGAESNILNEINYKICATSISQFDFDTYDQYKKLGETFESIKDECNKIDNLLRSYSFKFEDDTYRIVKDSGMDLSGQGGDRHIVFFSTVRGIAQHKDAVKRLYNRLYPNCNVRVFEYHSLQSKSDSQEVLDKAVNSIPSPYTVDVIMTVNKGTESIHPRHIRSVMMFRHTASQIVFTQQMGRGVTLREFCDDDTYIFDFSDGYISLLRGTSIEYGRRTVGNRVSNVKSIDSIDELTNSLRRTLSSKIKVKAEFATEDLRELSYRLNNLYSLTVARQNLSLLESVIDIVNKNFKRDFKQLPSIYNLEQLYCKAVHELNIVPFGEMNLDGTFKEEFIEWFETTVYALLNNRIEKSSEEYKRIQSMGHMFYLCKRYAHSDDLTTDNRCMLAIDSIRIALDNEENDYSKLRGKRAHQHLLYLRKLNMYNELSVPVCKYARDRNIDISLDRLNFKDIRKITPEKEADSFKSYIEEAKVADQIIKNINSGIDTDECTNDTYELWATLMAKHLINSMTYNSTYSNFMRHKIEVVYRKAFNYSRVKPTDIDEGKKIISIVNKYQSGEILSNLYQEYIFEHYGFVGLSDFCKAIFRELGIKSKTQYGNIVKSTKWDKQFNAAINGDNDAMVELLRTNVDKLDPFRQKMLNTMKFKGVKKQLKDDITPVIITKKAREFYSPDEERQHEIALALKNKVVTDIDIGTAPFNESVRPIVIDIFNSPLEVNSWIKMNQRDWTILKRTSTASVSCTSMIMPNIIGIKYLDKDINAKLEELYSILFKTE